MVTRKAHKAAPQDRLAGWSSLAAITLLLVSVGLLFTYDAGLATSLIAFLLVDLAFGREAAMMLGATLEIPPWLMVIVNVVQSLAQGVLLAVVIMYLVDQHRRGLLGRWASETRAFADRRRDLIDRWGPLGIFLFLLVPFLAKPVFGVLAGRLAGLEMRQLVIPVTAATAITAAAWAYFSVTVVGLLYRLWEGSGFLMTLLVVVSGVALLIAHRNRKKHQEHQAERRRGTEA